MKKLFRLILRGLYRLAHAGGLLSTRPGQTIFRVCYDMYKAHFEVGSVEALRAFVRPGAAIIDVGANMGFFTSRFGRWVSEGGRVIAIEPEKTNFDRLRRNVARRGLEADVDLFQAVAADATGELQLDINPHHPGDHRIGDAGVPVKAITIDSLLEARGWPEIGLIKIDVQGAEARVLAGARDTIERFHPALFVEIDDAALSMAGSGADELIASITGHGYRIHRLVGGSISPPIDAREARAVAHRGGYADLLFLSFAPPLDDGAGR
jgi:FkbM family methyltransferase